MLNFSFLNYLKDLVGWSLLSQILSNWCVSAVRRLRLTWEDNTDSGVQVLLSVNTQEQGKRQGKVPLDKAAGAHLGGETWFLVPGLFLCPLNDFSMLNPSAVLEWQELKYLPAEGSLWWRRRRCEALCPWVLPAVVYSHRSQLCGPSSHVRALSTAPSLLQKKSAYLLGLVDHDAHSVS